MYKTKSLAFRPTGSEEGFRDVSDSLESGHVWKEVDMYVIKLTFDHSGPWKVWVKQRASDKSLNLKVGFDRSGEGILRNADFRKMQSHGPRGAFLAELSAASNDTDAILD